MQSQLGIRRQRVRYLVVALLMLVAVTIGCGDDGPKVSDANKLFIEASKLIGEGQKETALEKLNESIAAEPLLWSYRERSKLLLEMGKDDAAMQDVDAALQLAPDDPDLQWLKSEIAKPAAQRFQGRFKWPPSSNR